MLSDKPSQYEEIRQVDGSRKGVFRLIVEDADVLFAGFTQRSRRLAILGQEQAHSFGHQQVEAAHLLLAILAEGECFAFKTLSGFDVTYDGLKRYVEDTEGSSSIPQAKPPFGAVARTLFDLSRQEAHQVGHTYVASWHILLAITRVSEGAGTDYLIFLAGTLKAVRDELLRMTMPLDPDRPTRDEFARVHEWECVVKGHLLTPLHIDHHVAYVCGRCELMFDALERVEAPQ